MSDRLAFVDIGELGWSLYLSAHFRWLKKNTGFSVAIITYPDRRCLYEGLADIILDVPKAFYKEFDMQKQDCFGLNHVPPEVLVRFFLPFLPEGYHIPNYFIFRCVLNFENRLIYEPYPYSRKMKGNGEVLIFPRCRPGGWLYRNLPEEFYIQLIERLCDEFPKLTIRTIGTNGGAYELSIDKPNYVDWIGRGGSLQDLINRCQGALVAIGSQSAPPKISLLQGVPTFIVGHQKTRHIQTENWMGTKSGFFQIGRNRYSNFEFASCIMQISNFVRECL